MLHSKLFIAVMGLSLNFATGAIAKISNDGSAAATSVMATSEMWPFLQSTWPDGLMPPPSVAPSYPIQGAQTKLPYEPRLSTIAIANSNHSNNYYQPLFLPDGECWYINNSSSNNYFVPLRTETEWKAFYLNAPSGVSFSPCYTEGGAASVPPPGGTPTANSQIFGNSCSGVSALQGHEYVYELTPIPFPAGLDGLAGGVDLLASDNLIQGLEFCTNEINVPRTFYTQGFPGFPDLNSWFGVCYDAGYIAPTTGDYTFTLNADDGAALWIDGELVGDYENNKMYSGGTTIGHGGWDTMPADTPSVALTAGLHDIVVKYFQGWPAYLGVQVGVTPPGQTVPTIMPLVGPPGGVINCPH